MTGDSDTITLRDAAQHFGFTVSTLRAEAERGRLTIYKIGKRLYTTPADIKLMVSQCRVEPKARAFTLTRSGGNTRSETARASSERADNGQCSQIVHDICLLKWWGDKTVADISPKTCRDAMIRAVRLCGATSSASTSAIIGEVDGLGLCLCPMYCERYFSASPSSAGRICANTSGCKQENWQ